MMSSTPGSVSTSQTLLIKCEVDIGNCDVYILITGMAILPVGAEEREDHVTDMSVFEKGTR